MKKVVIIPCLIFIGNVYGQTSTPNLFEVSKAFKRMYVDKKDNYFVAFDMGKYLDKAGVGLSIAETDTLFLQPDNTFKGERFKIEVSNNQMYISSLTKKKSTEYKLEKVLNVGEAFYNLNNAYFLDSYFAMGDRLNKRFELYHHSFRNGFPMWENLSNREMDYSEFKPFADKIIQQNEDSIADRQEYLTTITEYLISNVDKLTYSDFKDSINKIPAEFVYQSSYYRTVINRISKQRPEYVISLYSDSPQNRTLIEFAIEKDKPLLQKLKAIQKVELKLAKKK